MNASPAGPTVRWVNNSSHEYAAIHKEAGEKATLFNFRLLTDLENYPVDFHCIAGADRTGCLAVILNGVLGVPLDDLAKDWETTMSSILTHDKMWVDLMKGFDRFGDSDTPFMEKVEKYLLHIGITPEEIEKFRAIMLDD